MWPSFRCGPPSLFGMLAEMRSAALQVSLGTVWCCGVALGSFFSTLFEQLMTIFLGLFPICSEEL